MQHLPRMIGKACIMHWANLGARRLRTLHLYMVTVFSNTYKEPNKATYMQARYSTLKQVILIFQQGPKNALQNSKFKVFPTNFIVQSPWCSSPCHLKRFTLFVVLTIFRNFMNNFEFTLSTDSFVFLGAREKQNHQPCREILTNVLPTSQHLSQLRYTRLWQSHRELHRQEAIEYCAM